MQEKDIDERTKIFISKEGVVIRGRICPIQVFLFANIKRGIWEGEASIGVADASDMVNMSMCDKDFVDGLLRNTRSLQVFLESSRLLCEIQQALCVK